MDNYKPLFDIGELIAKYLQRQLSADEQIKLDNWLKADPRNRNLFNKLTEGAEIDRNPEFITATEREEAWKNIVGKTGYKKTAGKSSIKQLLPYAAAIFLLVSIGITASKFLLKQQPVKPMAVHLKDLPPGRNKAILKLADGSEIVLDESSQGEIAHQQNISISKTQNGQVIYQLDDTNTPTRQSNQTVIQYNTIQTPRGGQYEVVLPDGTRVWLNAASSLKYTVLFSGNERRVELNGEAYFEVAKDASKPFFVKTASQTIQVLGTHFNVNSYTDEQSVKTTLLEGSVKINLNNLNAGIKLSPGEQAVNHAGNVAIIHNADVDEALAWKNGKFLFRNTDLQTIMRQLSRWYDVDVEYEGKTIIRHYKGRISRNVPVSQVFEILKTSGLNFIIDGRKIIVKS